ncbi:type II toxin-antitoxin system VapC family toxin [Paracoccus aminophilus]|uniref:Ribonuclease VapC n=1 Tax=Paracoccus aminophilus JCM 7686 TaxID=1367847 RepID=S5Y1B8_PARAH|nr:type II toxin-antitoxin system VapC family toxin [Paracoccus aminophilus]AGT11282.1 toxin of toxin-antitoxin system [Paracoccus aminophilus JCM 7686]
MYLLDTNVISALRRPERAPAVAQWLRGQPDQELYLSVITLGEIERGIARQEIINPGFARDLNDWLDRTTQLFADRILPFGSVEARIWGRLSATIGHDGADLMIAATALARDAIVVTGNMSDFTPSGCRLLDPFQP